VVSELWTISKYTEPLVLYQLLWWQADVLRFLQNSSNCTWQCLNLRLMTCIFYFLLHGFPDVVYPMIMGTILTESTRKCRKIEVHSDILDSWNRGRNGQMHSFFVFWENNSTVYFISSSEQSHKIKFQLLASVVNLKTHC
jgi:hypothetical protein